MPSKSSIKESDYDSFVAKHQEDMEINKLFKACVKLEGSDLHLKVGRPPMIRVDGTLRPMSRGPIDDEEMVRRFSVLYPQPTEHQPVTATMLSAILKDGGENADVWRSHLMDRMQNMSAFMKILKQL